jgi:PadR family transcriptional regulator, regulatory protein PadR
MLRDNDFACRFEVAARSASTALQHAGCSRLLPRAAAALHFFPRNNSGEKPMADQDLPLLQGTLDVLVLKTLSWGPRHGYAIARWIRDTTDDELQVEDRALYVALHRMEQRGWIESEWGFSENNRKAKYYQLTQAGRRQLRSKSATWARYSAAVTKVLQTV